MLISSFFNKKRYESINKKENLNCSRKNGCIYKIETLRLEGINAPEIDTPSGQKMKEDFKVYEGKDAIASLYIVDGYKYDSDFRFDRGGS